MRNISKPSAKSEMIFKRLKRSLRGNIFMQNSAIANAFSRWNRSSSKKANRITVAKTVIIPAWRTIPGMGKNNMLKAKQMKSISISRILSTTTVAKAEDMGIPVLFPTT